MGNRGFLTSFSRNDSEPERVMQKAGMKFEGFIEHSVVSDRPESQTKLYAIRSEDFDPAVKLPIRAQPVYNAAQFADQNANLPARERGSAIMKRNVIRMFLAAAAADTFFCSDERRRADGSAHSAQSATPALG